MPLSITIASLASLSVGNSVGKVDDMRTSSLGLFRSFVAISLFLSFNVSTLAQKTEESVIFNFDGPNGAVPYGGLISDSSGNLYGTTSAGGTFGDGTVFELIPGGNNYTEMVLYSFTGGNDGGDPFSSLVRNSSGICSAQPP